MVKERVQKIIAASGFCSRRKAEEFIIAGKVTVNGMAITIGDSADAEKDHIMVGKKTIVMEKHLYLMLHKPSGFLTTKGDLWGRKDIMSLLPDLERSVYPIGRLDRDARGLLLLTSDGEFAQNIMHPSNETTKTYQATLDRAITKEAKLAIQNGVKVGSRRVRAKLAVIKPKLVELTIHEGRNKIVKRYFNELGYNVNDLKRVGIGKLRLSVQEGKYRELTEKEKNLLVEKGIPRIRRTNNKTRKSEGPRKSSFSKDKARKAQQTNNLDSEQRKISRKGKYAPVKDKPPKEKMSGEERKRMYSSNNKNKNEEHKPFERKTSMPKRKGKNGLARKNY